MSKKKGLSLNLKKEDADFLKWLKKNYKGKNRQLVLNVLQEKLANYNDLRKPTTFD